MEPFYSCCRNNQSFPHSLSLTQRNYFLLVICLLWHPSLLYLFRLYQFFPLGVYEIFQSPFQFFTANLNLRHCIWDLHRLLCPYLRDVRAVNVTFSCSLHPVPAAGRSDMCRLSGHWATLADNPSKVHGAIAGSLRRKGWWRSLAIRLGPYRTLIRYFLKGDPLFFFFFSPPEEHLGLHPWLL